MDWTSVVSHPLGVVAFTLALVFGVAGVKLQGRQRPWFLPTALVLAAFTLLGCLYLAHRQILAEKVPIKNFPTAASEQTSLTPAKLKGQTPNTAPTMSHQETHGSGSPAVQGVHGDVKITVDQGGNKQ